MPSPSTAALLAGCPRDVHPTGGGGESLDASTWYLDDDWDGYGDPAVSEVACVRPSRFVADGTTMSTTSCPSVWSHARSTHWRYTGILDPGSVYTALP